MIYIIGAGYMAKEYAKVLTELGHKFQLSCNSEETAVAVRSELGVICLSGGHQNIISELNPTDIAIVCVPVDALYECASDLMKAGCKKLLLEKPGSMSKGELQSLISIKEENQCTAYIGYNRRFYQSTLALDAYLKLDELTAVTFEITEWGHIIKNEPCSDAVKNRWMFANTSHVVDLVSHIAGEFKSIESFTSGQLDWHKSASRFVGAGETCNNVLFNYCGFWDGPGRWSVDFITESKRFIFRPMEKLQIQNKGSILVEYDCSIDYSLDEQFKPGLYLQTKAFIEDDYKRFCTLEEQVRAFDTYSKMANYNS